MAKEDSESAVENKYDGSNEGGGVRGMDIDNGGGSKPIVIDANKDDLLDNGGGGGTTNVESEHNAEEKANEAKGEEGEDIAEEQLEEYKEWLDELGIHAEKVTINCLTMVAEDFAVSRVASKSIYDCIRNRLMSKSVDAEHKLPLVYLLDSILKNVGGEFVGWIEADAKEWIPVVHASLFGTERAKKFRKVLQTWCDFSSRFRGADAAVRMVKLFDEADAVRTVDRVRAATSSSSSSSPSLLENVSPALRSVMQALLDEIHSEVDELDKVSLERLEAINPSLLGEIKKLAVTNLEKQGLSSSSMSSSSNTNAALANVTHGVGVGDHGESTTEGEDRRYPAQDSLFVATTTANSMVKRSRDWADAKITDDDRREVVRTLQQGVRNLTTALISSSSSSSSHPQQQQQQQETPPPPTADDLVREAGLIAAMGATANYISDMLQILREDHDEEDRRRRRRSEGKKDDDDVDDDDEDDLRQSFGGSTIVETGLGSLLKATITVGAGFRPGSGGGVASSGQHATARQKKKRPKKKVDLTLFTTEGIVKMDHAWIVASLHEGGLPFLSTSDGRRFRTQLELSQHLDEIFRKGQLEKTMVKTDERGWHVTTVVWKRESTKLEGKEFNVADANNASLQDPTTTTSNAAVADMTESMFYADEDRKECAICGNPFLMYFDHKDGNFMYRTCVEVKAMNDDAAEEEFESVLVHSRCLQGLGTPEFLTRDQVMRR